MLRWLFEIELPIVKQSTIGSVPPSGADFITIIVESNFRYRQVGAASRLRIAELRPQGIFGQHDDPITGFIDYVPVGSIKKGEALATTGDAGKTIPCAICHGQNLKGLGEIPGIVDRPATYVFRQLNDMQNGNRKGAGVELMKGVVAKLTDDDLIALAAYLGSRDP